MRIVVNDIAAVMGGAMTILKQFYNFIRTNDFENEWIFLLGNHYLEETERIKVCIFPEVKASRLKKICFDCFTGRKYINALEPDVVVSLQNIITFGMRCPQVVYIHQSIPFQNVKKYSFLKKEERSIALIQYGIGAFIKASVKQADCVAVQTHWMKRAVVEKTGINKNRIMTVFPDIEQYEKTGKSAEWNRRIFFYPTNDEPYKNIGLIVEACELLRKRGIVDFKVNLTLPEGTIKHPNIQCIARLNHEQMGDAYRNSTLVFPSLIETVGLPMVEARSCGALILASQTPFALECLEGYANAVFFDPFDAGMLSDRMEEVLSGGRTPQRISDNIDKKSEWKNFYKMIIDLKNERRN